MKHEHYVPLPVDSKDIRLWIRRNTTFPKFIKKHTWGDHKYPGVYLNGPDAVAVKIKFGI